MSNPPQPFASRMPSTAWEPLALPGSGEHLLWLWFRPPHLPHGVLVRLPPNFETYAGRLQLTPRSILALLGLDASSLAAWFVFGSPGLPAALDLPLPAVPAGLPPELAFVAHTMPLPTYPAMQPMSPQPAVAVPAGPTAVPASVPAAGSADQLLARIDSEWTTSITLERQLSGLRKKVSSLLGKLSALDKGLTPEERLHADNADVKDWEEARRWLRDVSSRAQRYVKEHDIGITSMAGRRRSLEETYRTVVEPRQAQPGLESVLREFDAYRKSLQTLLNNMSNAYSTASQEGERRAHRVLARIRAKARSGRSMVSRKKPG